ncbi:hypothetical protein OGAPHI_001708 [Ogataea philodendri]|uniref:Uncharacterized protein n=1 Tax=Ogataea philodendri TaxID=1378263 RepID=A0A9P8T6Z6_9ASCO|nr:uncharacterized protein OGAPHI_001708 [Ogataea philodendri]KAH3667954.1 hypothetical protein OGAPHI_001708 [Ogataea philodendri]
MDNSTRSVNSSESQINFLIVYQVPSNNGGRQTKSTQTRIVSESNVVHRSVLCIPNKDWNPGVGHIGESIGNHNSEVSFHVVSHQQSVDPGEDLWLSPTCWNSNQKVSCPMCCARNVPCRKQSRSQHLDHKVGSNEEVVVHSSQVIVGVRQHKRHCNRHTVKDRWVSIIFCCWQSQVLLHPGGECRLTDGSTGVVVTEEKNWEHKDVPSLEKSSDTFPGVSVSCLELSSNNTTSFKGHLLISFGEVPSLSSRWGVRVHKHGINSNRNRNNSVKHKHPFEWRQARVREVLQDSLLERTRH